MQHTGWYREIVENEERVVWAQIVEGFNYLRQPERDFHVAVNGKPLLAFEEWCADHLTKF